MLSRITDKKAFVNELLGRLKSRIEATNESEKAFAKRVGSSDALFKNLTSGSLPSADRLDVLLKELDQSLVLGSQIANRVADQHLTLDGADYALVPMHDALLSAGPGANNDGANITNHLVFRLDWLKRIDVSAKNARLARVIGESMAPGIQPGDLVMIDTAKTTIAVKRRTKGSKVAPIFAFIQDGEARVKRIERPEAKVLVLMSDNPTYPTEIVTDPLPDSITILGQVVWSGHVWR